MRWQGFEEIPSTQALIFDDLNSSRLIRFKIHQPRVHTLTINSYDVLGLEPYSTYCFLFRKVEIPKGKYKGQLATRLVATNTTDNAINTRPNVPGIDPEK